MGFPTRAGWCIHLCVTAPFDTPSLPVEPAYSATGGSITISLSGVRSKSVVVQITCVKCPADLTALCRAQMVSGGVGQ